MTNPEKKKKKGDRSLTLFKNGFTLIENLTMISIIGIFSAIAAPSWLAFFHCTRLNTSIDRIYWAMQTTREEAKRNKEIWQISFRDQKNTVQWAIHSREDTPTESDWISLEKGIQIDTTETTFYQNPFTRIWRMQFDQKGRANGQLGKLTLSLRNGSKAKRCIFVSTLLGNMRKARNNRTPREGKYCY